MLKKQTKKQKTILHQGQETLAAQLLRFLGNIDLHNINDLNKKTSYWDCILYMQ